MTTWNDNTAPGTNHSSQQNDSLLSAATAVHLPAIEGQQYVIELKNMETNLLVKIIAAEENISRFFVWDHNFPSLSKKTNISSHDTNWKNLIRS